jgi:tetratricopeptide (TPR) repeat protein
MKTWLVLLLSLLLNACAVTPAGAPAARTDHLFNDALFAAPSERIDAGDVFAVNADMLYYLQHDMAHELKTKGPKQGLFDALKQEGRLRLAYDTAMTRNAAQTFAARSGNCLSLVIMTAALAKQIGLSVQYQSLAIDETWSRNGNTYFSIGHVNLILEKRELGSRWRYDTRQIMTIDFLPPADTAGYRTRVVDEKTIVAMYLNNRAAETLAEDRLDDAYWWAREAVRQDPGFASAYNTLGAVYRRHGNLREAHLVLREALGLDPRNTVVMYNLANVLTELGRTDEARRMNLALAKLEPYPPYHFFELGMAAMRRNDFAAARSWFAKEVARDPGNHEFHYWLGTADWRLGNTAQALRHLGIALENSTTRRDHALYAAKLDRIKAAAVH